MKRRGRRWRKEERKYCANDGWNRERCNKEVKNEEKEDKYKMKRKEDKEEQEDKEKIKKKGRWIRKSSKWEKKDEN